MTDEQIIKALKLCTSDLPARCDECPYVKSVFSCESEKMKKDALDLINRQKAEIESLREEKARFDNTILYDLEQVNKIVEEAKAEAVKEFALRAKSLVHHTVVSSVYGVMLSISENAFDNLAKEMVGEGNV